MREHLTMITLWNSLHLIWMASLLQTLQKLEHGLLCRQVAQFSIGIVKFELCTWKVHVDGHRMLSLLRKEGVFC